MSDLLHNSSAWHGILGQAGHVLSRIGDKEGEKIIPATVLRIEPDGLSRLGDDYGHAIVDGCQHLIGFGRDDRAGMNGASLRRCPGFIKTGKTAGMSGMEVNEPGFLRRAVRFLPLVETIGDDETTTLPEGVAETGFIGDGFRPGVDQPVADGGVLSPGGDEPPAEFHQAVHLIPDDGGDLPAGVDIIASPVFTGDIADVKGRHNPG